MHSEYCSLDLWQCEVIARYFSLYSAKLSFWNVSDTHGSEIMILHYPSRAVMDKRGYLEE